MPITVVPRYGRDYKSIAAVTAAVRGGVDITVADMFSVYDMKAVNAADLLAAGETQVRVRYARQAKVTVVNLTA